MQILQKRKMKKFKLKLAPLKKSRQNKTISQILRASGRYKLTLYFKTRKERLNYLINIFKPYANKLTAGDKRSITVWLKDKQKLTEEEVKRFYQALG